MTLLSEDRDLLAQFREGKREALERVFRHYVGEVARFMKLGFPYQSGGKPARFPGFRAPLELENMVQEVFTRALEPRARLAYDGLRPYRLYLLGIARHVALRELERRAIRAGREESIEALPVEPAAASTPVDESLDERRARKLVESFLAEECDERDRRLFGLRFDENLSQEMAGRAAGLTRIQIRRWEDKLRARLLAYLRRARWVDEP